MLQMIVHLVLFLQLELTTKIRLVLSFHDEGFSCFDLRRHHVAHGLQYSSSLAQADGGLKGGRPTRLSTLKALWMICSCSPQAS